MFLTFEDTQFEFPHPTINETRICLPFRLFFSAFHKTHSHGHSGEKLSIKTFNQFYYIPHLPLWFSIFIHDCIDCQQNKHFQTKPNISPHLLFMKTPHTLIIAFQWIPMVLSLHLPTITHSFLLLLTLLVTLLSHALLVQTTLRMQ